MIQSLLSQACNFLIDFIKNFKVKWGEGQETLIKKKNSHDAAVSCDISKQWLQDKTAKKQTHLCE